MSRLYCPTYLCLKEWRQLINIQDKLFKVELPTLLHVLCSIPPLKDMVTQEHLGEYQNIINEIFVTAPRAVMEENMNNRDYASVVLNELHHTLSRIDIQRANEFVELVDQAQEVFCAGAGRSGFQVKGFAMRLMHMGISSYVVGETCTPNIRENGLLVICSGSGETKSLVNHANKAKEVGAKIALITINPESTIAKLADVVVEISAPSPKSAKQGDIKSIQPMGSLFEQSEGIFMDISIMMLMEKRNLDSDTMFGRHANME